MTSPRGLHSLARLHGIQTAYHDHAGRYVGASPESLMAVLRALGVRVRSAADIPSALQHRRRVLWERVVEPVVVAWLPDPGPLTVRVPGSLAGGTVRVIASLEEGGERVREAEIASLAVAERRTLAGRDYVALEAPLPAVPPGYHDLVVEVGPGIGHRRHRSLLIAAPRKCAGWEVLSGSPGWGVFVPLYALWEQEAPDRIPDFGLLDRLATEVAALGGNVVGTLPLLASFLDRPYEPSPYAPVSKLFWNELYVGDPPAELGARRTDRNGRAIDPRAAMAARRRGLREAADRFYQGLPEDGAEVGTSPATGLRVPDEMAAFVARNPRAPDYARFRALTEFHGPWPAWPDRLRARDVRPGDYEEGVAGYHLFAQWRAERQLTEAAERAASRGVALYLDLPLGVHPEGYDVWRERSQFSTDATVGAPPDPMAPGGQDWGFHPIHPEASRFEGHRYFIAALRKHLRFARVLRIDHVMQLHRMFWVPGGAAADGVYVRYPHEELYAILSLESRRAGTVVVGEDLGTVPRVVRRALRRHGVPGTYVVQFALDDVQRRQTASGTVEPRRSAEDAESAENAESAEALVPGRVPAGALAAIGTHDTPMFAAWWTGRDAEIRAERGLMSAEEARKEVRGRQDLRDKLARGLGVDGDIEPGTEIDVGRAATAPGDAAGREELGRGVAAQRALYRFLGESRAGLVLATLEDLWMETEPQNVPGTPAEANWRRRTRHPLKTVAGGQPARLLATLNDAREGAE